MSTGDARVYAFGPFRLDTGQRLLLRDGTVVPVAAKVFETLQLLVEAGGRVLSKEELIESLWPDTFVEEGNLAKNVSRLRKLLGKSASGEYIATIPKRGYRFVANVTAIGPAASGRLSRQTPITSGAGDGASRTGAPVELRRLEAIAVLPFRAFGPAADEGYLSVGLADALITQLGATGRIAVRPTSAVLPFAAGRASAAEAPAIEANRQQMASSRNMDRDNANDMAKLPGQRSGRAHCARAGPPVLRPARYRIVPSCARLLQYTRL